MADATKPETKAAPQESKQRPDTRPSDPANPPLTRWNWTPDIVAGLLGGSFGVTLALLFGFIWNFIPGTSPRVFFALIVLGVAAGFAHICYHMELGGRRYFQQAFSMLTPFSISFFTFGAVLVFVSNKLGTLVGKYGASTIRAGPLDVPNPAAGAVNGIASVLGGPTRADLILWTSVFSIAIIIPFFIHSLRERAFKVWWLLPGLFPGAICWGISLLIAS